METRHKHVTAHHSIMPFLCQIASARKPNPASHGNITERSECACGSVRLTNVNGRHIERGQWSK